MKNIRMNQAATSVFAFSIWLAMGGAGLLFLPTVALSFLGVEASDDLFARLLGMVMLILAYYYLQAARSGLVEFFRWSVHARVAGPVVFVILVVLGVGPPILLALGAIDLLAALWTWRALKGINGV